MKANSARKGRKDGKGERDQEGTGPAELSSFSGPGRVWGQPQLTEPFRPLLEPRLSLSALRGPHTSAASPEGGAEGVQMQQRETYNLKSKEINLGTKSFVYFQGSW